MLASGVCNAFEAVSLAVDARIAVGVAGSARRLTTFLAESAPSADSGWPNPSRLARMLTPGAA
jgi:hypothetical protein